MRTKDLFVFGFVMAFGVGITMYYPQSTCKGSSGYTLHSEACICVFWRCRAYGPSVGLRVWFRASGLGFRV